MLDGDTACRARAAWIVLRENAFSTRHGRRVRDARLRLHGNSPDPGGEGVVLVACDGATQEEDAVRLVRSADAAGPHRVHVHLHAPLPVALERLDGLRRELGRAALTFTWEDDAACGAGVPRDVHVAAWRFVVLHHLLPACAAPVLCVDPGTTLRAPLAEAFARLASADVTLLHAPAGGGSAAPIGFRPSHATSHFTDRAARAMVAALGRGARARVDGRVMEAAIRLRRTLRRPLRVQRVEPGLAELAP